MSFAAINSSRDNHDFDTGAYLQVAIEQDYMASIREPRKRVDNSKMIAKLGNLFGG